MEQLRQDGVCLLEKIAVSGKGFLHLMRGLNTDSGSLFLLFRIVVTCVSFAFVAAHCCLKNDSNPDNLWEPNFVTQGLGGPIQNNNPTVVVGSTCATLDTGIDKVTVTEAYVSPKWDGKFTDRHLCLTFAIRLSL